MDLSKKTSSTSTQIISDLQDYKRPFDLSKTDFKQIVDNVFITTNVTDAVKVQVIVREDMVLFTDATYLRRPLTNLISNAIQAMPNGGKMIVEAS